MIKCKMCGLWFLRLGPHLRVHGVDTYEYRRRYPGAETESEEFKKLQSEVSRHVYDERPEVKELHSRVQTALWEDPTYRKLQGETLSDGNLRRVYLPHSEEAVETNRRAQKKYWEGLSPEERQEKLRLNFGGVEGQKRGAEGRKKYWKNLTPEERLGVLENSLFSEECRSRLSQKPNKTERMLWEFLEEHYLGGFVPQWERLLRIGRRYPDFYSLDGYKVVIESFGSRFHGVLAGSRGDEMRGEDEVVAEYEALGWDCIVVWADSPSDIIVEWPNLVKRIDSVLRRVKSV